MAISLLQYAAMAETPKRQGIIERVTNESVFLKQFTFVRVDGFAYEYSRRDTLGGIAFRGLNGSYNPDIGVVNPQIERLAIMGGQVNTDYQIANKQGDIVRASAIAAKARKIGLQYDKYVLQGDQATNALAFFGLNARLIGLQVIGAGGAGVAGALSLATLDQAIDQVVGADSTNKILVCNKYVRRVITALLRPQAIGATSVEQAGGIQVVDNYRGCPIMVLDEDGDEAPILPRTESYGGNNATTSLYVIRVGKEADGEYCQGLIGGNMVDHIPVGLLGTYYADIVEANIGLGVFHPRAAARIVGIT